MDLFNNYFCPLCDEYSDLAGAAANLAGTAVSTAGNVKIAEDTNDANIAIANATNEVNRQIAQETNATNLLISAQTNESAARQAELAYQRSTASNQILELVRAGMSIEQARNIVAGEGANASYTAAPVTGATMVPGAPAVAPTLTAATIPDLGPAMGQVARSVTGLFTQAYSSPDGGDLGLMRARDAMKFANTNISAVPVEALSSQYAFQKWLDNLPDKPSNKSWIDFRNSNTWRSLKDDTPSFRAFMYNLNSQYGSAASIGQQIQKDNIAIEKGGFDIALAEANSRIYQNKAYISDRTRDNDVALSDNAVTQSNIETNRMQFLAEKVTKAEEYRLQALINNGEVMTKCFADPTYKDNLVKTIVNNAAGEYYMSVWTKLIAEGKSSFADNNPDFIQDMAMIEVFKSMGLQDTLAGSFIIESAAAGLMPGFEVAIWKSLDTTIMQQGYKALYESSLSDAYYSALQGIQDVQFEKAFSLNLEKDGLSIAKDVVKLALKLLYAYLMKRFGLNPEPKRK